MKRENNVRRFILAVAMCLLLCFGVTSCGKNTTVTVNGKEYSINQKNHTISDGTNTYDYDAGNADGVFYYIFTYPDGGVYKRTSTDTVGKFIEGSYNPDYPNGAELYDAYYKLRTAYAKPAGSVDKGDHLFASIILSGILIIFGVAQLFVPVPLGMYIERRYLGLPLTEEEAPIGLNWSVYSFFGGAMILGGILLFIIWNL